MGIKHLFYLFLHRMDKIIILEHFVTHSDYTLLVTRMKFHYIYLELQQNEVLGFQLLRTIRKLSPSKQYYIGARQCVLTNNNFSPENVFIHIGVLYPIQLSLIPNTAQINPCQFPVWSLAIISTISRFISQTILLYQCLFYCPLHYRRDILSILWPCRILSTSFNKYVSIQRNICVA